MLSRHGLTLPPHKSKLPVTEADREACARCLTDAFGTAFYSSLLATDKDDEESTSWHYSRVASDVYKSALGGCPWCERIGNAIVMSANWDYMIHHEDRSDGPIDSDEEEMSSPGESPGSNGNLSNNEEDDEDPLGQPGSLTYKAMDCSATLDITIEYTRRDGGSVFNMVDVTIEISEASEGDVLFSDMGGEPVRIKFEVMSPDISPAFFPRAWAAVSAASDDWVGQAQSWLEGCNKHKGCESDGNFQPTRLIDVRNPQHLKLVSREDVELPCRYATLSYVWGPTQTYTLEKATYRQMHTKLDSLKMAKTISDGVTVARRMGFEYLWVDAVCIIQDSAHDKLKELPSMAAIYRESQLTIVAASSASADNGIFQSPDSPSYYVEPFEIKVKADEDRLATLIFGYRKPYRNEIDPINSRAWTLQERVLSKRLLIFSRGGVMWMCRKSHINVGGPADAGPPYQTSLDLDIDVQEADEDELREQWMSIRADYSEMNTSYCSDKLPAISAVASELSRRTNWTYLAGMWRENLFSELHWKFGGHMPDGEMFVIKPQKVRDAGYIAPSWSWASIGLGVVVDGEDERDSREIFDFEILDCQVDVVSESGFKFGPVKSGFLVVRGKIARLSFQLEDWQDTGCSELSLLHTSGDECGETQVVGVGTLDPMDDIFQPNSEVYCLGMSRLLLGKQQIYPIDGLLLLPTGGVNTFHRVGFFRMHTPSLFNSVNSTVIQIE